MEFITAAVTIPDIVYQICEDAAKAIGNPPHRTDYGQRADCLCGKSGR